MNLLIFFGGVERFESQIRNDEIKAEYATSNNFGYLVLDCRRDKLKFVESKLSDFFRNCSNC